MSPARGSTYLLKSVKFYCSHALGLVAALLAGFMAGSAHASNSPVGSHQASNYRADASQAGNSATGNSPSGGAQAGGSPSGGAQIVGSGPLEVPEALKEPGGVVLALAARGVGVQIYVCAAAKEEPTHYAWTLKSPEAELLDPTGKSLGRHYAGPTWEAADGSKVIGELVATQAAPEATAIPWLLLRAKSTSGSGVFGHILSIQRLHTVGGKAPAGGCDATLSGTETRAPYSAEYRFYAADARSPIGLWKTIDDKTGKARALVRVYEEHGRLFGRIEQTFTAGGEHRVCVPCTDERKNQPIIGLVVIRNIRPEGGEYVGGDILDPESGSVYRCKMHLEQGGSRLVLRGYIGFSLLGRSQTWQRQG